MAALRAVHHWHSAKGVRQLLIWEVKGRGITVEASFSARMKDIGQSVKDAAQDELRYELIRFAARTTAHGIPMA